MFWNGNTAIEGLSWEARGVEQYSVGGLTNSAVGRVRVQSVERQVRTQLTVFGSAIFFKICDDPISSNAVSKRTLPRISR